ncbi:phage tail tube protein [Ruminococcus sp.]|uniref:phage tail tube protein n=1 Tax=Ruminococcus sp. TaxID=41978 RepID=UPI001B7BCA36|nr:phage tail tube protein [Ruminococcus sp.]MBP5432198.1 hypothetical protein [Ruminococcus sp.]
MGEFNSKGTILSVAAVPQSGDPTYKKLYGLFTVPEMGGTPEMIDVTNLEDSIKRNIPGIGDTGTLDFEFYATEDETDTTTQIRDTWNILRGYQTAGTTMMWKLEYPDGEGFTWKGKCSVRRQSVGVNNAIKFTLTVGLETGLDDI